MAFAYLLRVPQNDRTWSALAVFLTLPLYSLYQEGSKRSSVLHVADRMAALGLLLMQLACTDGLQGKKAGVLSFAIMHMI